jgi:hypothetical protein
MVMGHRSKSENANQHVFFCGSRVVSVSPRHLSNACRDPRKTWPKLINGAGVTTMKCLSTTKRFNAGCFPSDCLPTIKMLWCQGPQIRKTYKDPFPRTVTSRSKPEWWLIHHLVEGISWTLGNPWWQYHRCIPGSGDFCHDSELLYPLDLTHVSSQIEHHPCGGCDIAAYRQKVCVLLSRVWD